uniref:Uncharacterized protein n=1 Tax=Nicotiana tabacum TaxID=4097 RepID=A0A1S3ZDH6_TOBAC|nr:PREDICTED: uncharacterized protein LOC107785634 [Nicotiana tabacum]
MSTVNDNNQLNQQGPTPPHHTPTGSPHQSRGSSPESSTSRVDDLNDQTVEQDALKQLIAERVNSALQAFVRGLINTAQTPPPVNTTTLENPHSVLDNSRSGENPNESRDGGSGSSVNIIFLRVVNERQANDKVIPKVRSLSGFDNSSVITKGEVLLTIFAEHVVKDTNFHVIEANMTYNIFLGRLWIHDMDVVPSTLHQLIKFPSQWGIHQIRGDQQASRSINSVVIASTVANDADAK